MTLHVHILPAIMGTEHHSARTLLLESGCKLNTLKGIKQTGREEGEERDGNSKTDV